MSHTNVNEEGNYSCTDANDTNQHPAHDLNMHVGLDVGEEGDGTLNIVVVNTETLSTILVYPRRLSLYGTL